MENFRAIAQFQIEKDGLLYYDECQIDLPMISGLSLSDSLWFWQDPDFSGFVNTLVAEAVYNDYDAIPVGYTNSEGQRFLSDMAVNRYGAFGVPGNPAQQGNQRLGLAQTCPDRTSITIQRKDLRLIQLHNCSETRSADIT